MVPATLTKAELIDELCMLTNRRADYYSTQPVSELRITLDRERKRAADTEPTAGSVYTQPAPAAPASSAGADGLFALIAQAVEPHLRVKASMDDVIALVNERLAEFTAPTRVHLVKLDGATVDVGVQHRLFGKLLKLISLKRNVFMHGAPGGGKTTAASKAAEALDLPFYFVSFSSQTTATKLTGFMDARGQVVTTVVRQAVESGGVLLLDEVDKASPAVLAEIHALMSQRMLSAPDGVLMAHENLVILAAANTAGLGGTTGHETAQRMDVAFRSRFVFLRWEYDEALEESIALGMNPHASKWVRWVFAVRAAVAERVNDWKVVIDPRCTFDGAALLTDDAFTFEEVADMCLFKACDPGTRAAIVAQVGIPAAA